MHSTQRSPEGATRTRLLAAALELIAEDGIQAVSHRATEERAGVSRGLTRYYFKTRDALLAAALDYVAELDQKVIEGVFAEHEGEHVVGVMSTGAQINGYLAEAFMARPDLSLARFELYLYAARRPELAEHVARSRDRIIQFGTPFLAEAGAPQAAAAQRLLMSAFSGVLFQAVVAPHEDYARWLAEWMARLEIEALRLGTSLDIQDPPAGNAPQEGSAGG